MGKFVLIIWIGSAQTQSFDTLQFDTMADCQSARLKIAESYGTAWIGYNTEYFFNNSKCVDATAP